MYALNLADDGRILSITLDKYGASFNPRVESFPEGNTYEYRYVDGEFIYDPLPIEEEKPTPTILERFEAQLLYTALMTDTLLETEE